MAGLDPEDDTAPGDTTSTNAAQPGMQKAWNAWTSKPENNAALLQFGLAMLQPRSPGQSAIGAAANAVAEGGGAAGRVLATQRAEDTEAASEADKAAQRENQATAAGSGRITANAYADSVKNAGAKTGGMSGAIKTQQAFQKWLMTPIDAVGLTSDPILGALKKAHPELKDKSDLLANPQLRKEAFGLFQTNFSEPGDDGSAPAAAPSVASPPPMRYKDRIIHVDPTTRSWVYEDGSPAK